MNNEIKEAEIREISGIGEDGKICEVNSENRGVLVERTLGTANYYYQIAENESGKITEIDFEKNAVLCSIYCLSIEIYIKSFIFNSYKQDQNYKKLGHCLVKIFDKIDDDYKECFKQKYFERHHKKLVEELGKIDNDFIEKRYIYEQFEIYDDLELTKRLAKFFKEMSYNELECQLNDN